MLKVIVDLLTRRPDLLVEHATAYVELLKSDAQRARALWLRRIIASATTAALAVTTLIVCGITATLCKAGILPWSMASFDVGAVLLGLTLAAALWTWRGFRTATPGNVGAQLRADAAGLHSLWSGR